MRKGGRPRPPPGRGLPSYMVQKEMTMTRKSTTGWSIAIGAGIGTVIGVALGHVGVWLPIGAAIGLVIANFTGNQPVDCTKLNGTEPQLKN